MKKEIKMTPKLKELYADIITICNIDDVFKEISIKKIPEVIVDRNEMFMITQYMIANATSFSPSPDLNFEKINWLVWKALREGRVDKFMGIKLSLDD